MTGAQLVLTILVAAAWGFAAGLFVGYRHEARRWREGLRREAERKRWSHP